MKNLLLHSSPAGQQFSTFYNEDVYTTIESERLLRLPMYWGLKEVDIAYIIRAFNIFWR